MYSKCIHAFEMNRRGTKGPIFLYCLVFLVELILFPKHMEHGWSSVFSLCLHSRGFCYSWAKADGFKDKHKTNILTLTFHWFLSHFSPWRLLKFKFWALHFIWGLFPLINKIHECVARIEIPSLTKTQEAFLVRSSWSHQLSLWYC